MDDEDNKARRNLVIASSVIILISWLNLPLETLADRLLGATATNKSIEFKPVKVWLAAIAMLAYFSLRFRFSKDAEDGLAAFRTEVESQYRKRMQKVVEVAIKTYERSGSSHEDLMVQLQHVRDAALANPALPTEVKEAKFRITVHEIYPNGLIKLSVNLVGSFGAPFGKTLTYRVPVRVSTAAQLRSSALALFYSKGSMALAWPVGLAYAALAIAISEVVGAAIRS